MLKKMVKIKIIMLVWIFFLYQIVSKAIVCCHGIYYYITDSKRNYIDVMKKMQINANMIFEQFFRTIDLNCERGV